MADVAYNTASFPSLSRTLASLIQLSIKSSSKPPLIVMGYKERDPQERVLWELVHDIGVVFELLGKCDAGDAGGGEPVEVWIGHVVG